MRIGERLRELREAHGYSQEDLAQVLHVTRQSISRWENEKADPSLAMLVSIAELYDLSLEELFQDKQQAVIHEIDRKVRWGKWCLRIGLGLLIIGVLVSGTLLYGRKNQIVLIDRFNPFLKTKIEYAIAPTPEDLKKMKNKADKTNLDVDLWVTSDPFGSGEWIKMTLLEPADEENHYVIVRHKGSYVSGARVISKNDIPKPMQVNLGNDYVPYESKADGPRVELFETSLPANTIY
ncbi:helix-turn-helix domain-containing protein [Weissella minor]|uniref:helix-turn-helix domain-containing protein n=1 Tax=Weissella minor TaxID=1620 RepID=UPI003AF227BF